VSDQPKVLDCFIAGGQSLPLQCAEILLRRGHRIQGIATNDGPFASWARSRKIPCVSLDEDVTAFAAGMNIDCLFSIVNGTILPNELLQLARHCAINFHDGPLPKYAGFNVTTWALLHGESRHGITWHGMGKRVDAGDIYKQVLFDVSPNETAFTLNAKCYEAALRSFGELVDGLADGTLVRVPQDLTERSYFPRFNRPAGGCLLDFERPAEELDLLSRALDYGPYPNPMGMPKFWDGQRFVVISGLSILPQPSGLVPGTIVSAERNQVQVCTATNDVILRQPMLLSGEPWVTPQTKESRILPRMDVETADRVTVVHSTVSRHEPFWVKSLRQSSTLVLDWDVNRVSPDGAYETIPVELHPRICSYLQSQADGEPASAVITAFLAQLVRAGGLTRFDVGFQDLRCHGKLAELPGFATAVPLRIDVDLDQPFRAFQASIEKDLDGLRRRETYLMDLFARDPELKVMSASERSQYQVGIRIGDPADAASQLPMPGRILSLVVSADATHCLLKYHSSVISQTEAIFRRERLVAVLESAIANSDRRISSLPAVGPEESNKLLMLWNQTETPFEDHACIHHLFERQAAATPTAIALACENREITYRDLNERADQLASHLRHLGVGPDVVVAVMMERCIDIMTALMGILKAGAAYLPIDPTLPSERVAFMLEDAGVSVALSQESIRASLSGYVKHVICLDSEWDRLLAPTDPASKADPGPDDLAYLMYTSGSTGQPKGVAITHRNVTNFFAGMDKEIGGEQPGVWLAVTSISFDISVLELFWTLVRGFKVVLAKEEHRLLVNRQPASPTQRPMDFSLFYFASNDEANGAGKYRLLIEGAKFADTHGFAAVWTPERHFHAFGGLYPNPSVTSAAVAAITKNVGIRAGSVVAPLHNPIRVAEEWSVVDNLSNGRVGISFASGWHARDFVLAPDNYKNSKEVMFRSIEEVRKLWRGETLEFVDGTGKQSPISIVPRPVQKELPCWVTAAGNPDTFRMAGDRGFNLLTHLLGQKVEDLAAKIKIYRDARKSAGFDPATGHVTLMLHTLVAGTREEAREAVREPLKKYLQSSVDLIKNSPWSFPAFTNRPGITDMKSIDLNTLTPEEMETLLEHSFDRYFETSGLFGTPDQCANFATQLQQAGVDEIACLVDFGVDPDLVLENLSLLAEVCNRVRTSGTQEDNSLPSLIDKHGVTHLQCTPSMAKMMVLSPDSRNSLKNLKKMMVGGEALPATLAKEIADLVAGDVHNMYGPTETTIWSTTAPVRAFDSSVSIGRPIANTTIYILDSEMNPVPIGTAGDLYIGGAGVAKGYFRRPQLTSEKFLPSPFRAHERLYKTGDIAKYHWDGSIEFLGRSDHQVKIRGFRIELGEIEAALNECPEVRDCVVVAGKSSSEDRSLVAYFVPQPGAQVVSEQFRKLLRQRLPEYMVPPVFVEMAAFPLTHNGKIDRKALPRPDQAASQAPQNDTFEPSSELERVITGIWKHALNRGDFGADDNFFDLGGHSILVVQVNAQLREALGKEISLVEMFRFPTIRSLARHIEGGDSDREAMEASSSRARLRRELLASRRQVRQETSVNA